MNKLFIFGFGYVAQFLANSLKAKGWEIAGTTRDAIKASSLKRWGYEICPLEEAPHALQNYDAVLYSIPPSPDIDLTTLIPKDHSLKWFGYLSATSVYGDHHGSWVNEESETHPISSQGQNRLQDEKIFKTLNLPLHIFRLSGIYGPKRNTLNSVLAGKAQRIDKPGHFISRIHVADIIQILEKSLEKTTPGEIFNLSDNHPCASREVIEYACSLLGHPLPELIPYSPDLSPHLRHFYDENRRVCGTKALKILDITLKYPSYKEGLDALIQEEFALK